MPYNTIQTRIGVNCPSKSSRPLANAAADICRNIMHNTNSTLEDNAIGQGNEWKFKIVIKLEYLYEKI